MDLQDFMSQLIFFLAAVLVVSAVAKLLDLAKPKFLEFDTDNAFKTKVNSITSNKIIIFLLSMVELGISVGLVAFANSPSDARTVFLLLAAGLFAVFTLWTSILFFLRSKQPCLCFGALSRKQVKASSIIRNIALVILSVAAISGNPETLTFQGVFLCSLLLGVILFEEIR